MITVLADHNIEGQALLLWGTLSAAGWLELVPLRLVRFAEIGLPADSTDRTVWRFAQAQQMYLLTDNRNMEGDDSLEQTIREENRATSLPVLTIGRVARLTKRSYREACAARLLEIVLYPEDYVGAGRIFIP
ncbi:MAG: hypothetical protein MI924_19315 [Chloroflexales bacterium]|nr:hypothetical protein [Chloroflexales bacterium]